MYAYEKATKYLQGQVVGWEVKESYKHETMQDFLLIIIFIHLLLTFSLTRLSLGITSTWLGLRTKTTSFGLGDNCCLTCVTIIQCITIYKYAVLLFPTTLKSLNLL